VYGVKLSDEDIADLEVLKPKSDETVSVTGLPLTETGAHCRR